MDYKNVAVLNTSLPFYIEYVVVHAIVCVCSPSSHLARILKLAFNYTDSFIILRAT
jgi:hypothetical protein